MDVFSDNDLLTLEMSYRHNPDVQKLIAEIRERRAGVQCYDCAALISPYEHAYCASCRITD